MADAYIRVDGWSEGVQPGEVTIVTVEDRTAAEDAATAAEASFASTVVVAAAAADSAAAAALAATSAEAASVAAVEAAESVTDSTDGQLAGLIEDDDSETRAALDARYSTGSGSGIVGAPSIWPSEFNPSLHTHPAAQISDATTVTKAFLVATTAQAARAAIGAGTGNGTSNLTLGSLNTQAAPGNHVHTADVVAFTPTTSITATSVQAAIEQAASMGGGGSSGTSGLVIVKYASGAYPTQAATPPAGVTIRHFYGPTQYTGAGWAGVLDLYTYAALA